MKEVQYPIPSINPLLFVLPQPTACNMFEACHVGHIQTYISAWCMTIAQHRAQAYNAIEALECFCRKTDSWTKATDVINNMRQNMTFGLRHYFIGVDDSESVQEDLYAFGQAFLALDEHTRV